MKSKIFKIKIGKETFEFELLLHSNQSSWTVSTNALARGEVMAGYFDGANISVGRTNPCVDLFADQLREYVSKELPKIFRYV